MTCKAVRVVLAGAVINFSLGVFYAWSVFAEGLILEYGWTQAEAAFPYTVELLVFGIAMIFAGRFQDKFGPRQAAILCGILSGTSLILCYFVVTPLSMTLFFGVLFGIAPAFGYASTTPTAMKWFPPEKRGLVTGLVVMPMGAAPLVWSPLVKTLLDKVGVKGAFGICGILVLVSITLAACALVNPEHQIKSHYHQSPVTVPPAETWISLIRKPTFVYLWLIDGIVAGIGLMYIGQLAQIALLDYTLPWGYLLVALFSVTNTLGRLGGGFLCDRIGWISSIKLMLLLQAASFIMLIVLKGEKSLILATLMLGACFGLICSIVPLALEKIFGLHSFGFIYGMLSTASGTAGFIGPLSAATLADYTGGYQLAFSLCFLATLACFFFNYLLKKHLATKAALGYAEEGRLLSP